MLSQLNPSCEVTQKRCVDTSPQVDDRWNRNEQDDLKEAIDLMYDFKKKLNKLHPRISDMVETMLQRHGNRF